MSRTKTQPRSLAYAADGTAARPDPSGTRFDTLDLRRMLIGPLKKKKNRSTPGSLCFYVIGKNLEMYCASCFQVWQELGRKYAGAESEKKSRYRIHLALHLSRLPSSISHCLEPRPSELPANIYASAIYVFDSSHSNANPIMTHVSHLPIYDIKFCEVFAYKCGPSHLCTQPLSVINSFA